MLGQSRRLALGLHKLDQWIIHWNTRSSIFLTQMPFTIPERVLQFFIFAKINPIGYKNGGGGGSLIHGAGLGIGVSGWGDR
jgi:hypothetical protein